MMKKKKGNSSIKNDKGLAHSSVSMNKLKKLFLMALANQDFDELKVLNTEFKRRNVSKNEKRKIKILMDCCKLKNSFKRLL